MEEYTRLTFRLKQSLYNEIKTQADENMRSLNKQMEYMLEQQVAQQKKEQKENR